MNAHDPTEVVVVSDDHVVIDAVLAAAAAIGRNPMVVCDAASVVRLWARSQPVFIGADALGWVADLDLSRRPAVFLVGVEASELALWSARLGAEVVPLPDGAPWLPQVMAAGVASRSSPVLTIVAGSGGVGASTLAAGIAYRAARHGVASALVDLDVAGGGIDLLLGAEAFQGWRWPRLASTSGHLGSLAGQIPSVDGVDLVSMARDAPADLSADAVAAVLGSLQRDHALVVVDPGRTWSPGARETLRLSDEIVLVVSPDLRGVAAARQTLRCFDLSNPSLVVRMSKGAALSSHQVEDLLACPVVVELPDDPTLSAAAQNGEPPGRVAKRPYSATCAHLVEWCLSRSRDGLR